MNKTPKTVNKMPAVPTENLLKACDSFGFFFAELREAHTDAVNSDNQFAEIALYTLIEKAADLRTLLARVKDAAEIQKLL